MMKDELLYIRCPLEFKNYPHHTYQHTRNFWETFTLLSTLIPRRIIKTPSLNPAYGRHQLSRPMRILGPIQIWRGCVIFFFFFCNRWLVKKNSLPLFFSPPPPPLLPSLPSRGFYAGKTKKTTKKNTMGGIKALPYPKH
jgi:hypothetical protein